MHGLVQYCWIDKGVCYGCGGNREQERLEGIDACSLLTFMEDGVMLHKLFDHQQSFPASTPILMLVILPFCALAAHDSARFVKKHFDSNLKPDSQAVGRLRNASKSLSSKGLTVEGYTELTASLVRGLSSSAKRGTGLFGPLINSLSPDVGIMFYEDRPVCATFVTARYMSEANGDPSNLVWGEGFEGQLGFDLGVAAAPSFYAIDLLDPERGFLAVNEFKTSYADCHYSDILLPLKTGGINNAACFFMLSEFLVQLNAVFALSENGMFDDILRMKYGTAVLFAFERSLAHFVGCAIREPSRYGFTSNGVSALSSLLPREIRKRIRASKDLRNAFIHYDFSGLLGSEACQEKEAGELLAKATRQTVKMSPEDYLLSLDESMAIVAERIDGLIALSTANGGMRHAW